MTLPKILAILALVLFGSIGVAAFMKNRNNSINFVSAPVQTPLEIELDQELQEISPAITVPIVHAPAEIASVLEEPVSTTAPKVVYSPKPLSAFELPDADRIEELFNRKDPRLPIVQTITYKSKVDWQQGRPAWLSDYAGHYGTSRHFIARSLNGKPDYFKQEVVDGEKFNVFNPDKHFQFYLVVDTSRCKMWFYYLDEDLKQKVLLKTYQVGLGRIDSSKTSGLLTPLGKYSLGDRIAIYKPNTTGTYQAKKIEMMTVFGTRWIPFDKELGECTESAKGFGVHGTPWSRDPITDQLTDNDTSIGKYESDGCIRLATPDIEELFAIIITKPTTIEIVRDFSEATFVGQNLNN